MLNLFQVKRGIAEGTTLAVKEGDDVVKHWREVEKKFIPVSKYSVSELHGMDQFAGAGFNRHRVVEAILEPNVDDSMPPLMTRTLAENMFGYVFND